MEHKEVSITIEELPQLYRDLEKLFAVVPYGELNFSVKRHNGKTIHMDGMIGRTFKFKDQDSLALATMIQLVKTAMQAKMTGQIAFAVNLKDGSITLVRNTDHKEINYPLQKSE